MVSKVGAPAVPPGSCGSVDPQNQSNNKVSGSSLLQTAMRSTPEGDLQVLSAVTSGPPEGKLFAALKNQTFDTFFAYLNATRGHKRYCSLCSGYPKWVLIAATGRSGSTTTLNMLQRIPGFHLAGENNGIMSELRELYVKTREGLGFDQARHGSYGHGPISEERILCALQQYVKALLGKPKDPHPLRIGFKEASWNKETLDFASILFPCAQIVIQTRQDLLQQSHSAWWSERANALEDLQNKTGILENWQRNHPENTFLMHLEDFSVDRFNTLLGWLGVSGCHYTSVCHANANDGYEDASSDVHIEGSCSVAT